jgi:predicted  nucleic acid-binding Zn-ribbon protein
MRDQSIEDEVDYMQRQLDTANDKIKLIKEAKQRESKDLHRRLDDSKQQTKTLQAKVRELEQRLLETQEVSDNQAFNRNFLNVSAANLIVG